MKLKHYLLKKKFVQSIIIATFVCFINSIHSQVNCYSFASSTGASLASISSTTTLVAAATDEGSSAVTNIGFTFTLGSTNYTQFSVNSNGLMKLGGTAVATTYNNNLTDGTDDPKITAYWDDISTGKSSSGSKIHYKLMGSSPNRYLVVEFLMRVPVGTNSNYNATFQVQLYETSNVIKFVYGTVPAGTSYSVGIAASASNFISVTTSSNTASTSTVNNSNSGSITSGKCYTFTPPTGGTPTVTTKTVLQASTGNVGKGNSNEAIVSLLVETDVCGNNLTQLIMNMTGCTAGTSDVSKIHVYYTGTSNTFAASNAFDGVGTNAASGSITITGSQSLVIGVNYFWIAYDINSSATVSNVVDAQITSFTYNGSSYTPTSTNPSGTRSIAASTSTTIASYPLTSSLADATGTYGNYTLSGSTTGPNASGVGFTGVYMSSAGATATITGIDATNFELQFDVSATSFDHSFVVGGAGYRWIGAGVDASGYIYAFYNNSNYITSATTISTGTYYTYKLSYSAGTLNLYKDGTNIISNSSLPTSLDHNNEFSFLTTNYSSGRQHHGYLRNFTIANKSSPPITVLPVELSNIEMKCENTGASIFWTTATETNNDFFTIERSQNGLDFEPVAIIDGAGNSNTESFYSFKDELNHENNLYYYRLKQTDYDGTTKIISLETIECSKQDLEFKIISFLRQNNHIQLNCFINKTNENYTVMIHDMHGRTISSQSFIAHENFNSLQLDFNGEPSIYVISVHSETDKISEKIIIHH